MRKLLGSIFALAFAATTAHAAAHAAAPSAPGVSLNWDRCFGDGSVQYRNFACDVNTGSDRMVGSFELTSPMPAVTGLEIVLEVGTVAAVPQWWLFTAPGGVIGCRGSALGAGFTVPAGANACTDWAGGLGAGGLAGYRSDLSNPTRRHVAVAEAVLVPVDLTAGQEYFAFTLNLQHTKSTGAGSCAGCLDPAVIFLSSVNVVPATGRSTLLTGGANYTGSQWVSWQMGYPSNIFHGCGHITPDGRCALPYADFIVVPYSVTPTQNSTWGQVKSLYR
ncbi:MAG: hypothetical protein ABL977_07655 [Candidatus Eisenbacteria bacterium]